MIVGQTYKNWLVVVVVSVIQVLIVVAVAVVPTFAIEIVRSTIEQLAC